MDFFVFQSEKDDLCYGFTVEEAGANLPPELAPWTRPNGATLPQSLIEMVVSDAAAESLKLDGYHLVQIDPPNVVRVRFGRR
jgi:hypothetical protein